MLPATHDAAVGQGRYPIILLSHGGGKNGGSPMILGDISAALARAGFIVIAPFHPNHAPALRLRPPQIVQALAAVLADKRFKDHADPARLGMLGYSLGGTVALSLAGATPDPAHFVAYCDQHRDDIAICLNAPRAGSEAAIAAAVTPEPTKPLALNALALKALALLDPFAAIYDQAGLKAVTIPVLLYRPETKRARRRRQRRRAANRSAAAAPLRSHPRQPFRLQRCLPTLAAAFRPRSLRRPTRREPRRGARLYRPTHRPVLHRHADTAKRARR